MAMWMQNIELLLSITQSITKLCSPTSANRKRMCIYADAVMHIA